MRNQKRKFAAVLLIMILGLSMVFSGNTSVFADSVVELLPEEIQVQEEITEAPLIQEESPIELNITGESSLSPLPANKMKNLNATVKDGVATFTVPEGYTVGLHLTSYIYPEGVIPTTDGKPWTTQILLDTVYKEFGPGEHSLKVKIPECGPSQTDLYTGILEKIKENDFSSDHHGNRGDQYQWVESTVVVPPHHDIGQTGGKDWNNVRWLIKWEVITPGNSCPIPTGSLTVNKTFSDQNENEVTVVLYEVKETGDEQVASQVTDGQTTTFEGLDLEKEYKIAEFPVPVGYQPTYPEGQGVTFNEEYTATLGILNTVIPVDNPGEEEIPTTTEAPPVTVITTVDRDRADPAGSFIPPEPVPLGAPVIISAPPVEQPVMMEEEVIPLGVPVLPKTGELPIELFYGLGGMLTALGAYLKRR